jgi:hypothetical protein
MKYFLIFAAAMAALTNVNAQEQRQKTVLCAETDQVLDTLKSDNFQEHLQWTGKSATGNSRYALMVNPKTEDWTLIQFNEKLACVLGTGVMSTFSEKPSKVKQYM